jgi:hypothetical protein
MSRRRPRRSCRRTGNCVLLLLFLLPLLLHLLLLLAVG